MPVVYDKRFIKHFRERVKCKKRLYDKYVFASEIFFKNPEDPQLRSHKLKGRVRQFSSFWIDDDCRVIYKKYDTHYFFYDVGSHSEVYK